MDSPSYMVNDEKNVCGKNEESAPMATIPPLAGKRPQKPSFPVRFLRGLHPKNKLRARNESRAEQYMVKVTLYGGKPIIFRVGFARITP